MSLISQLLRKIRHHGILSLFRTSPRSVRDYFLLNHIIGVIDRQELLEISGKQRNLWRYGSGEIIKIGDDVDDTNPFHPIEGTYEIDRPFVCEIENSGVIGSPTPNVFAPDGRIVLEGAKDNRTEAMHRMKNVIDSKGLFGALSTIRDEKSDDNFEQFDIIFPLIKRPSFSYYHWIGEYLPKIRGLEEYERETGRLPDVLIENDPPDWLRESLRLMDVPSERCKEWRAEKAHVNRLVIAAHREKSRGDFLHPSAEDFRWVRDRILSNIEGMEFENTRMSELIYVSRRLTEDRRALNEQEVMDILEPLGFVSYALEELSVAAQARLFSQAEVIVGPHGAGLLNLMFSDESTKVLDLINEKHLEPGPHLAYYYYVPATILGIDYHYMSCEAHGRDMIVDTSELEEVIKDLI